MIEEEEVTQVAEKFNSFLKNAGLDEVFTQYSVGSNTPENGVSVQKGFNGFLYVPYSLSSNKEIVFDINSDTGEMYQIVSIFTSVSYGVGDLFKHSGDMAASKEAYTHAYQFSDQMNFNHVVNIFPHVVDGFKKVSGFSSEQVVGFFIHHVEVLQKLKEKFAESVESMAVSFYLFKKGFNASEVAEIFLSDVYDRKERQLTVSIDMLEPYVGVPVSWLEKIVS